MPKTDDSQLLREFMERQSDATFGALATRHINLVYSVALRQSGNPDAAEEITQAVFIILARKAASLGPKTILSGWLYQTARLRAANFLRSQNRRQQREQEAYMQSLANEAEPEVWPQIAPLLDDALGKLGERDRHAIVLRFFENKSLGEVGAALGASENAAKMRVNRALEKLWKIFSKRGVTLTATLIAGAVSANSVQAAPVGLAATVTVTAAAPKGTTVAASTAALVEGTMKMMTWLKLKFAAGVGVAALLVGSVVTAALTGTGDSVRASLAA
jgi:RNA polymerase sigma factor (sigma-70 family)